MNHKIALVTMAAIACSFVGCESLTQGTKIYGPEGRKSLTTVADFRGETLIVSGNTRIYTAEGMYHSPALQEQRGMIKEAMSPLRWLIGASVLNNGINAVEGVTMARDALKIPANTATTLGTRKPTLIPEGFTPYVAPAQ